MGPGRVMSPAVRAAAHPVLSSPRRLAFMGLGVTLAVQAVQLASGVPSWLSWSPVELSSNVVATMGFAWAAIQLRAAWREPASRRAWLQAAVAMALLAVEGYVGEVFLLQTHGQHEMSLSIALWLIAAWLLFRTARRHAMRRSVEAVMRAGFSIQVVAQLLGWWTADGQFPDGGSEFYEYLTDTGELAAVLAYLAALLLAVFSADKSYAFPLSAIGLKGRRIHRDFRLREAFPQAVGSRPRPLISRAAAVVSIGRNWRRIATLVHRDGGPSPLRQIGELLGCGALQRIGPRSYYALGLFLRHGDAALTQGETRNGLTASIQSTRRHVAAPRELDDPVAFGLVSEAHGLPVAPILGVAKNGAFRLAAGTGPGALDRDLVVRGREGVALTFTRLEPSIYRSDDGVIVNHEMVVARIAGCSRRGPLVVQPRLANHPEIASLARASLIVFRVVTCLDEAGEPRVTHGLLRILRGAEPDWPDFPETQWGSAIELVTGRLGPLVGDAFETCTVLRHAHPVTREMVTGRICAGWPAIARTALDAHRVFGGHVVVGWDLAWTPEGPRLLRGVANMGFDFIQRCYGTPIGQSPLGPLLNVHLDRVVEQGLAQARPCPERSVWPKLGLHL